jgi:MerC mercury resistance protein
MADLFAVSSSGLCMIHCLATPVLLIFVPVFSASFLGGEAFHAAILWFILPTSLVAMTLGCWRHKDRYVAVLCVIGLSVIVVAARFGDAAVGEIGERILTTVGSFILIAGHFATSACVAALAARSEYQFGWSSQTTLTPKRQRSG